MFLENLKDFFIILTMSYNNVLLPFMFGTIIASVIYFDKIIKIKIYLFFLFFIYFYTIMVNFIINGFKWGFIKASIFLGMLIILYKCRFIFSNYKKNNYPGTPSRD